MKIRTQSIGILALAFLVTSAVTGCWATRLVGELSEADNEMQHYGVIAANRHWT